MAMVTDRLTLRGAMGTLDADYARFDYAGWRHRKRAQLSGRPELTYNIGAEHISQMFGGELIITANYSLHR